MRFFYSSLILSLLFIVSCSDSKQRMAPQSPAIRIAPEINTRATDTNFEQNDAIGVTIRKQNGTNYLENKYFSYDGISFSSIGTQWYPEAEDESTIIAYYPYTETGNPQTFTVKSDQRGTGYDFSDLLGAKRNNVKPALSPIDLTFYHLLAKIDIKPDVSEGTTIEKIIIGGFIPTAVVDLEAQSASVKTGASASEIIAREVTVNKIYDIILPPQKAVMQITVDTKNGQTTKQIPDVTLLQGKRYELQMTVTETGDITKLELSGQIQDWGNGGVIEQNPDDNSIIVEDPTDPDKGEEGTGMEFGGIHYETRVINGKEWMAENLRYKPAGTVSYVDFWYPQHREDKVPTLGLLYSYATAMAGEQPVLNDASTIRGICPEGWRLPMIGELVELAKAAGKDFFSKSGFYYMDYDGDGYNDVRNYILSSTHPDEERVQYLRIPNVGDTESQNLQTISLPTKNIASSVRCVKQ